MRAGWMARLAVFLGVLMLWGPVLAQRSTAPSESRHASKRIALIIGNGSYQSVARLPNPVNDARLMAKTLEAAGFTLIGGGAQTDLTKAQFDHLVQQFGQQLLGADVALFYYSGHGMQVQGENWLVPVDANPTTTRDLDFQMMNATLVLRQMEDSGTKLNMVILDACRNNPFAIRGVRAASGGLGEMAAPEGTLISYATQPGNVALDGDTGDSPYTLALVQAIQQPGSDVFHVFNQVGLLVKSGTGGQQQPWLATSPIAGSFYFFNGPVTVNNATNAAVAAPAPAVVVTNARSPFDGLWDVDLECPSENGGEGYSFQFTAKIDHGSVHGQRGVPGDPGSLTIDGALDQSGAGLLSANGRTNRRANNVEKYKELKAGSPYSYSIDTHFSGDSGTGARLGGVRSCRYSFKRVLAAR